MVKETVPSPCVWEAYPEAEERVRDGGRCSQSSHPSRIWLGFSPSRVRTKTCPLFQSPVWMPLASPATPARNRRARLASQPHLAWVSASRVRNKTCPLFQPPIWMPLSPPTTPARNPPARLPSLPHVAVCFCVQGA